MRYRVVAAYQAAFQDFLAVDKGERLRFERKPTDWNGWIWCTTDDSRSAWVPESWVETSGEFCVLLKNYSSKELSVSPGDELEIKFSESGWVWVCSANGEEGWIPADRIEPA